MNTKAIQLLRTCLVLLTALPALAQTFSSGSTGADGPLNATTKNVVLDVPPNGIFNFTTINIASGIQVTFRRNAANTPVYFLTTGNVTIAGAIYLDGSGGSSVAGGLGAPGGGDGGSPGSVGVPPGAGYGPGAGRGGTPTVAVDGAGGGSFSTVGTAGSNTNKGVLYANALLLPLIGGSGGGGTSGTPGAGGGGGGGGILIASSTRIDMAGGVFARGGNGSGGAYNGGSGGGIRLIAPVIAGNGTVSVDSPAGCGFGRIRVDAIDRSGMNFNFVSSSVTSVGSLMLVFPSPLPRLDILEAAGTPIAEGSGPVIVQLPFGSSPNRTIKVQARDFNATVPITVMLTPDHGTPLVYTSKIENTGTQNPATISVDVVLPVNEQTTVSVYSK